MEYTWKRNCFSAIVTKKYNIQRWALVLLVISSFISQASIGQKSEKRFTFSAGAGIGLFSGRDLLENSVFTWDQAINYSTKVNYDFEFYGRVDKPLGLTLGKIGLQIGLRPISFSSGFSINTPSIPSIFNDRPQSFENRYDLLRTSVALVYSYSVNNEFKIIGGIGLQGVVRHQADDSEGFDVGLSWVEENQEHTLRYSLKQPGQELGMNYPFLLLSVEYHPLDRLGIYFSFQRLNFSSQPIIPFYSFELSGKCPECPSSIDSSEFVVLKFGETRSKISAGLVLKI